MYCLWGCWQKTKGLANMVPSVLLDVYRDRNCVPLVAMKSVSRHFLRVHTSLGVECRQHYANTWNLRNHDALIIGTIDTNIWN